MYVGHISAYSRTCSPGRLVWSEGRRPPGTGAGLHSSNEPGELSQWLSHDDSTINIVICYCYYHYYYYYYYHSYNKRPTDTDTLTNCGVINDMDYQTAILIFVVKLLNWRIVELEMIQSGWVSGHGAGLNSDHEEGYYLKKIEIPIRYFFFGIRYFSVFRIPTSVSVSVFWNTSVFGIGIG